MGSMERSKKRLHQWKKAIIHFMICFIMGFFTGIAPTKKTPIFTNHILASNPSEFLPQPVKFLDQEGKKGGIFNKTLLDQKSKSIQTRPNHSEPAKNMEKERKEANLNPRRLIIVVSSLTSSKDRLKVVFLRRLANTLRLVDPPLLWVVVDSHSDTSEVPEILRKTGIMYRHLVYDKNFTDPQVEMDHQMNIALNHIEHHRLNGIVHFAGLSNIYDLSFFEEIRAIEVFGTWPMAFLSANRNRVIIEGPVCDSSEVIIGWHLQNMNINMTDTRSYPLHISSFAFNSSILWDPERWGRPSSVQDTLQNSLNFVKKEVLEEESKVKGIPSEGCSKIMLWHLHLPKGKTGNHHLVEKSTYDGQR